MDFKHIKEKICEHCGRGVSSQTKSHFHSNGNWNEYIEFECGRKLHFSPNFMEIIIEKECPKEKKEVIKNKKRAKFEDKLISFIEDYKLIDDDEKDRVYRALKYTIYGATEAKERLQLKRSYE